MRRGNNYCAFAIAIAVAVDAVVLVSPVGFAHLTS